MELGTCPICKKKNVGYRCFWLAIKKRILFLIKHPSSFWGLFTVFFQLFQEKGSEGVRNRFLNQCEFYDEKIFYQAWLKNSLDFEPDQSQSRIEQIKNSKDSPTFILVLKEGNNSTELNRLLKSIDQQIWGNYTIIMVSSADSERKTDPIQGRLADKVVIVENTEQLLINLKNNDINTYICIPSTKTSFHKYSLFLLAEFIVNNPQKDLYYGDHGHLINGEASAPRFKQDWARDSFYSKNYIGENVFFGPGIVKDFEEIDIEKPGIFSEKMVLEQIETKRTPSISHLPTILYHKHTLNERVQYDRKPLLEQHFEQLGLNVNISPQKSNSFRIQHSLPNPSPSIEIIIPSRDNLKFLSQCVKSITANTDYDNYHITIVDNQSKNPEFLRYLQELQKSPLIRVLPYPHEFNYSAINNFAVKNTVSDYLLFLNDDTEIINENWIKEMLSYAQLPWIGAVGAKLFYGDGRLQHAGVVIGIGGLAGHIHRLGNSEDSLASPNLRMAYNYSAVTAACLMVSREKFNEIEGFNETDLKVAYNDVELCLKLCEKGYQNLWTPFTSVVHHESISRGNDLDRENLDRFKREASYFHRRWQKYILHDPCYNPNLTVEGEDGRISVESRYKPNPIS